MLTPSEQAVVNATQHWLKTVVIGQNFCPFASRPFVQDAIRYQVTSVLTPDALFDQLTRECQLLDQHAEVETTLLIIDDREHESGSMCFDDYMDYLTFAQTVLSQLGFDGVYQIASFHPEYVFAGEPEEDVSHFTNRSPYPMLHILREASLSQVLRNVSDPEQIPLDNIARAAELGRAYFTSVLSDARQPENLDKP